MHCRPLLPNKDIIPGETHCKCGGIAAALCSAIRHADVDAHTRFAFVRFESDADAGRALALENGPYREAKRAHASINDRNATAAAAWDALCAKLRDVTAGAVVPRSHADRVAVRLAARGHGTLAVERVGVERLLLLRTNDPAAFATETRQTPCSLASACPRARWPQASDRRRRGADDRRAAATPPRAPVRRSASGRRLRRCGDITPPRGRDGVRSRAGPSRPRGSRGGRRPGADRGVVSAPNRAQARRKQSLRAY